MVEQVGRYIIKGQLGRGAMGVVYLADDPLLNRQCAIKTVELGSDDAQQAEFLRTRLLRDARAAAALSHPNIVGVFDVVEADNAAYLVMEYIAGETLAAVLNRVAIPDPAFTVHVLRDMAAALDYTHARGIVHRDIKPANVMIDPTGTGKIMDFGIARIADTRTTTPTGMVMGTVEYMSPEQVKGEAVDGRSDQFAVACVAYRMLTGSTLYGQHSLATLAYKIVNEAPTPARMRNAGLPAGVDAALSRGLAKTPAERFRTCSEFVEALAWGLAQPSREETTLTMANPGGAAPAMAATPAAEATGTLAYPAPPPKKSYAALIAVGAVLVLGAGGAAVWRPWEKPADKPAASATVSKPPAEVATSTPATTAVAPPPKTAPSTPVTNAETPAKNPVTLPTAKPPSTTPTHPDEAPPEIDTTATETAPPTVKGPAIEAHKHGLELLNSGQPLAAIDAFAKAISIRPEWASPYYDRARAYARVGDYNGAVRDYSQYLGIRPQNAMAHTLRGMAYAHLKDDDRALDDFNSAIALKPDISMAYNGRGVMRMHRNALKLALDDFNNAIRISPRYDLAYENRATAKRRLGDEAGAQADSRRARELKNGK